MWQLCPVRAFGVQQLYRITLERFGATKEIYATAGHRWFIERRTGAAIKETTTDQLVPGQRLQPITRRRMVQTVSAVGVAHGFVFGDGTDYPSGAVAYFCGPKDEALLRFFPESKVVVTGRGVKRIAGLPHFFKRPPDLSESPPYLYGWLAGYFAADGTLSGNAASLSSAARSNLEIVRDVANTIHIVTYPIVGYQRLGYGKQPTPDYRVTIRLRDLTEDFFVIPTHRDRWRALQERRTVQEANAYDAWRVVSVEPTDRVEEVFCAVVEGAEAFALEDSILTGNCKTGCGQTQVIEALMQRGLWPERKRLDLRLDLDDLPPAPPPAARQAAMPMPERPAEPAPVAEAWAAWERKTGVPRRLWEQLGVRYVYGASERQRGLVFPFGPLNARRFRPWPPGNFAGKYLWDTKSITNPPLWPLPDRQDAPLPDIFVTAGETDCGTLRNAGFAAFASTKGEGSPLPRALWESLYRVYGVRRAFLTWDMDEPGQIGAHKQCLEMQDTGVAGYILHLPDELPIIGGKDVNHVWNLLCERDVHRFRQVVQQMVTASEPWTPAAIPPRIKDALRRSNPRLFADGGRSAPEIPLEVRRRESSAYTTRTRSGAA